MDPYAEQPPPPARRHNGCLWGCIGTVIAAVVIFAAVFGYGGWYFYKIFNNDPRVQTVLETVQHDARAAVILGRNIKVLEVQMHTFDYSTGRGGTATYVLKVAGSAGEGELKADLDIRGGDVKIRLLILTDKNGQAHYLVGTPPPNPLMQNSI
jgi:predicted RNase H-related nuclease YkuK (DUF458 family)